MKLIQEKCFHQNSNTFYTEHFHLPTPFTHILLSFGTHFTFLRVIICIQRIIIDIIVSFMEGKEKHVLFFEEK